MPSVARRCCVTVCRKIKKTGSKKTKKVGGKSKKGKVSSNVLKRKKTKTSKSKATRPSPSVSAAKFKINTVKRGNDNQLWRVRKGKVTGIKRWYRVKINASK